MLRRLFRDKPLGAAGAVICAIFLFCGVFAGWLAPYGVNEINMMARLQPPSWAHLFGTDNLGRDIFSAACMARSCRW
jgi:peptide/nickel transport system permease protein